MKTICLVNFQRNENYLWETKYNAECSLLHKYLKRNGMSVYVYSEKDITSPTDIAENIVTFSDELCILVTRNENYLLNLSLAKNILLEEPDCEIIFWCSEPITEKMNIYTQYTYIYDNKENCLAEKLGIHSESKNIISGEYFQFEDDNDIMRFEGFPEIVIGIKDCSKIVSRNKEALVKDIEAVCSSEVQLNNIGLVGMELDQYSDLNYLLKYMKNKPVNFSIDANIEFLLQPDLELPENITVSAIINRKEEINKISELYACYKDRIIELKLLSELVDVSEETKNLFNEVCEHNIKLNIVANEDNDWKELNSDELMSMNVGKKLSQEFQTFMTGLIYSYTGEYITVPLNGFVKHVKVNHKDLTKEVLNYLEEACSINSSILVNREKQLNDTKEYHIDSINSVYQKNEWSEEIRKISKEGSYFPKNILSIEETKVDINGLVNQTPIHFIEMPYSQFNDEIIKRKQLNDVVILTLDQKNDLEQLILDADTYFETKSISHSKILHGRIKNMCRFLSRNYCTLTKLPRIEIDQSGAIYPCYEKGESIGSIEESLFELTQAAYVKHEKLIRTNKCSKCPANVGCPKCAIMPDFMKDVYCDLMINKPYVSDFILESIVLQHMSIVNAQIRKMNIEDIKFSNEYMQNILIDYENGTELPFFNKYVFIIQTDSFYAIWSPGTNKIYKISRELALIGEALLKKISPAKITSIVMKETRLTEEDAKKLCTVSYELFYKNNLLHRPVSL